MTLFISYNLRSWKVKIDQFNYYQSMTPLNLARGETLVSFSCQDIL